MSVLATVLYHTCAGTGSIVNMVDIDSRGLIILILKGSFFLRDCLRDVRSFVGVNRYRD